MKEPKKYKTFVLAATILFSVPVTASDLVSLKSWSKYGDANSGNWTVSSDGYSVYQSINGHPTAFMSAVDYSYRTFKGVIKVDTDAGDDDYIGMIFGDPNNNFYLFDWKKGATAAQDGFTLLHFDGSLDEMKTYGWSIHDSEQGPNTILGKKTGTGWIHGRNYAFEMQLYPNRIVTKIDGSTIFDVSGLNIAPSKFGFFNWSQGKVRYNSIKEIFPPIADNKAAMISQGAEYSITGTWTDKNAGESHTCQLVNQPASGVVQFVAPCLFKYTPSTDKDGPNSFSYRVTDEEGLYTDGLVELDVKSGGAPFLLPEYVEIGIPTTVNMNMKSSGGSYPNPTLTVTNQPSFMSIDSIAGTITLNAEVADLGLHENIQATTTNGIKTFDAGTFDIQVIPQSIDNHLEQTFKLIPSGVPLENSDGQQLATIVLPPLKSGEDKLVEGPHDVKITASSSNIAPVSIQGVEILPGESRTLSIDIIDQGTNIQMIYSTLEEGVSNITMEFPWLDAPLDLRYVAQKTCTNTDSNRCDRHLEMDRHVAPNGELQVFIRKALTGEYMPYGLIPEKWRESDLDEMLDNLQQGDIVVANIHEKTSGSLDFANYLVSKSSNADLASAISALERQGSFIYHHGFGLKSFKTAEGGQWGTSAVTWVNMN